MFKQNFEKSLICILTNQICKHILKPTSTTSRSGVNADEWKL